MDNNLLISLVKERPAIWNTYTRMNRTRSVVDNCWRDIGDIMGVNKFAIRKQWKKLRDHFRIELTKMQQLDEPFTNWEYFNSLLFLKDIIQRPKNPVIPDENFNNRNMDMAYELHLIDVDDMMNELDEQDFSKEKDFKNTDFDDCDIDSIYNKIIEEDEDEMFFKSLLPHCKKIPDNKKLLFRNKILSMVNDFAYNDGKPSGSL